MIVCICAAVDEETCKQALAEGKDLIEDLGCCCNCGHCTESVVELQNNEKMPRLSK